MADHFHMGDAVVAAKDATGSTTKAVWNALARQGLARCDWPHRITLTLDGLAYDTGLVGELFQPLAA